VVGSTLLGVIYFSRWWFLRRLNEFLIHFSLGFKENWAIFCAAVGFTAMVHAIRYLELRLFDCMGVFDRRSLGFLPAEMDHQNRCYAYAWGSYVDYHCNGVL
jgi:hypothetical protein